MSWKQNCTQTYDLDNMFLKYIGINAIYNLFREKRLVLDQKKEKNNIN